MIVIVLSNLLSFMFDSNNSCFCYRKIKWKNAGILFFYRKKIALHGIEHNKFCVLEPKGKDFSIRSMWDSSCKVIVNFFAESCVKSFSINF